MKRNNMQFKFTKHRWGIGEVLVILFIFVFTVFAILRFVLEPQVIEEKYELLIDLLGVLLAFAGIAGALVWKFIEGKVTEKIDKERNFSRYETNLTLGYVLWNLFREKDIEGPAKESIEELKKNLINRAIAFTKRAFASISKLDNEQYKRNLFWCKNNLVYYLAEKTRTKRYEITEEDEKEAMRWGNEIYQTAKSKGAEYEESYEWKESYAWALWCFGKEDKDNERRENALNIIRELKQDLKTRKEKKWYKGITKKYKDQLKIPSL